MHVEKLHIIFEQYINDSWLIHLFFIFCFKRFQLFRMKICGGFLVCARQQKTNRRIFVKVSMFDLISLIIYSSTRTIHSLISPTSHQVRNVSWTIMYLCSHYTSEQFSISYSKWTHPNSFVLDDSMVMHFLKECFNPVQNCIIYMWKPADILTN
jgi:hypothetical protein